MQEQDYSAQWKDLRIRITVFFISWLGGFLVIGMLFAVLKASAMWLTPLWFVAFVVSGWHWSLFPCPRCGKSFFKPSAWSVNQFLNKCPHCGLEKWTNYS